MSARTNTNGGASEGTGWLALIVVSASAYSPLMTWANAGESPKLPTLSLMVAGLIAIGLGLWRLLVVFHLDKVGSASASALFVFTASNTGELVGRYHALDRLGLVVLAVVIAVIGYRLRGVAPYRFVISWLALFVLAQPVVTLLSSSASAAALNVDTAVDLELSGMNTKPDILLVVFDAYASQETLRELYDFDNREVLDQLADRGFDAPGTTWANYGRTQLSVPSVLQLDYAAEATEITGNDVDALMAVLGGESRLSTALQAEGYRHVYVESGWLGSRCGPTVDVCVRSPWPDESFYDVVYRSVLRGFPGFEVGRSFAQGGLHVIDWLTNDLKSYLDDGQPDFIFAHALLPHPPLFLDGRCSPDWGGGIPGFEIGRPGLSEEETTRARMRYLDQVACVNSVLISIADQLNGDDVMIAMGDHGPDSQGQLFVQGTDWNDDQKRERLGAFLATKVPGCDMSDIESLVNVGRRMMSCLSGDPFPDLDTHIFDMHKSSTGNFVYQLEKPAG